MERERFNPACRPVGVGDAEGGLHAGVTSQWIVAIAGGEIAKRIDKAAETDGDDFHRCFQLQHQAGINAILAGRAEMHLGFRLSK